MVDAGDAKVQVAPKGLGGDSFFCLTEQGARKALASGEFALPGRFSATRQNEGNQTPWLKRSNDYGIRKTVVGSILTCS